MKPLSNIKDNSFFSGALWLGASSFLVKIFGVLYKIPLSYLLGDEGMGYFNTAYTVFSMFFILCASGIPKALTIVLSEKKTNVFALIASSCKVFFFIGFLISFLVLLLSRPISVILGSEKSSLCIAFMAPAILFCSLGGVYRGALLFYHKMREISLIETISGAIKLIFGLVFATLLYQRTRNIAVSGAGAIMGLTMGSFFSCLLTYCVFRKIENKNILKDKFSYSDVKRVFSVSVPITAGAFLMSFSNILDLMFIKTRLQSQGIREDEIMSLFGNYSTIALPMFGFAAMIISAVCTSVLPSLTRYYSDRNHIEFQETKKKSFEIIIVLTSLISFGFYFFPFEICNLLFSEESSKIGAPFLKLLTPSVIFLGTSSVIHTSSEAKGNTKTPFFSLLFGVVFKTVLTYFLLGIKNVGIQAVAMGTSIMYFIVFFISLLQEKRNNQNIGFYINKISTYSLIALISGATVYSFKSKLSLFTNNTLHIIFIGFFYCVSYFMLLFLYSIMAENGKILGHIRQKIESQFSHNVEKDCNNLK